MRLDLADVLMYTDDLDRAIAQFETIRAMAPDRWAWFNARYSFWHGESGDTAISISSYWRSQRSICSVEMSTAAVKRVIHLDAMIVVSSVKIEKII
jgi:hypothetical protein